MKRSQLKAILQDHCLWLESDRKQGKRANLWGANLEGANLEGADLRDANLESANLEGANLRDVNLRGADLEGANLWSANLQGAKFTTNFKKVALFGRASFSEDQIPWVVLHPKYPKWADDIKWVKAKAEAA